MSETIRVIVCRVDKETGIAQPPCVLDVPGNTEEGHLAAMQNIVGGLVEYVGGFDGRGTDLWCNEEGLLLDLPLNRVVRPPAEALSDEALIWMAVTGDRPEWRIHGDFFIARVDDEGGLASVTERDIDYYTDLFKETP